MEPVFAYLPSQDSSGYFTSCEGYILLIELFIMHALYFALHLILKLQFSAQANFSLLLILSGDGEDASWCRDKFWSQPSIKYHYQVKVAGGTLELHKTHKLPQKISKLSSHCRHMPQHHNVFALH